MKKIVTISATFFAIISFIFGVFFLCGKGSVAASAESVQQNFVRYSKIYYKFGVEATLSLYSEFSTEEEKNEAIAIGMEVDDLLTDLENSLSVSVEDSYVSKFNSAAPGAVIELDYYAYTVFSIACSMYEETEGYFNPGVYNSVDLYGFAVRSSSENKPYDRNDYTVELPDEKYVEAFRELAQSFCDIELYEQNGSYYVIKPVKTVTVEGDDAVYSLEIDLGGIGKGYAVDLVDELIDEAGYEYAYFNFASSSMSVNKAPAGVNGMWELEIRNPRGNASDYFMKVYIADSAVSTSGDYVQYYEIDGVRYSHLIDPSTGRPINTGIISATCFGGTAAENDARTTAICAMGFENAVEYINSQEIKDKGIKILFVYEYSEDNFRVYTNMEESEISFLCDYEKISDGVYQVNILSQDLSSGETDGEIWKYVFIGVIAASIVGAAIYAFCRNARKK